MPINFDLSTNQFRGSLVSPEAILDKVEWRKYVSHAGSRTPTIESTIRRYTERAISEYIFNLKNTYTPLWSSIQEFLATDLEVRVRLPGLPDFLRTGCTHPREYN
jgi:hypothetical protein